MASRVPFREPVSHAGRVPGGGTFGVAPDVALLVDAAREPRAVLLTALVVAVFVVSPGHESLSSRQAASGLMLAGSVTR
jgi:hypothetical protein